MSNRLIEVQWLWFTQNQSFVHSLLPDKLSSQRVQHSNILIDLLSPGLVSESQSFIGFSSTTTVSFFDWHKDDNLIEL